MAELLLPYQTDQYEGSLGPTYWGEKRTHLPVLIETVEPGALAEYFPGLSEEIRKACAQKIAGGEEYWYLARSEDRTLVGRMWIKCAEDSNLIEDVSVKHDYQRRGVATQLIKYAQSSFPSLLLVNEANQAGYNLYTRLGFSPVPDAPKVMVWQKNA